jgi:hypothetical protein
MKKLLILAVLSLSLNIFGKDVSWYKCFKGKVGEYPVTMHINLYGDQITGYYYYDKYMQPLTVMGNVSGDSLKLLAYSNSYNGERFNGVLKNGKYSGGWENDNYATLNFVLEDMKDISSMYEYVYVKGSKTLMTNFENSPVSNYLEGTIWPTDENSNKTMLRKIISVEKGLANTTSPGSVMLKNRNSYFDSWVKDNSALTKKDIEDMGFTSMYNTDLEDYIRPVYFDKNIMVLSRFTYEYTGGAHGNYGTAYSVYNLNTSKKLALADVITAEGIKNIPAILEKNYRLQNNTPDTMKLSDELFTDTIYANENFVLTPGCLMFNYVPYEIGPYAAGEIVIYIPINQVEKYLKPGIAKLLDNR